MILFTRILLQRRMNMKNQLSKKIVAVLLAAVLVLGSGITAALSGTDLGSLFSITASAEDPKNSILFDSAKGLFFVIGKGATIIGTNAEALRASDNFADGTYTLPNEVTDSQTGKSYMVFEVDHFAFLNSGADITKIIIPDNFRELTLSRSSFAGMKSLKSFEMNCANATVTGPLFELVTEYEFETPEDDEAVLAGDALNDVVIAALGSGSGFNGSLADLTENQKSALAEYCSNHDPEYTFDTEKNTISLKVHLIGNCFPLRDEAGALKVEPGTVTEIDSETGNEVQYDCDVASVRFFSLETADPYTEVKADRQYKFDGNMSLLTNINTVSKRDYDAWNFEATILKKGIPFDSITTDDGETIGAFEVTVEKSTKTVDGKTYNYTNYSYDPLEVEGAVSFKFEEVTNIGPENIVDGNGAIETSKTVVMFRSPVSTITLGSNVKSIPDYMFYDTDVDRAGIENAIKNATSIGNYSFVDCNVADSVDLSGITEIGEYAFAGCDSISEVTIPEETTSIGAGAFSLCDNLSTVKFNAPECEVSGNPAPFSDSGVETIIFGKDVSTVPSNVASDIPTLRNVIFLADELTIEDNAFSGSNSITNIETIEEDTLSQAEIGTGNGALAYTDIEIKKHEHTYNPVKHDATCTAKGYTAMTCVCGDVNLKPEGKEADELGRYDFTDQLDHEWDPEKAETIEASCETEGFDIRVCKNCGLRDAQKTADKLDHDLVATGNTFEANCEEGASKEMKCTKCGEIVKEETSEPLGHKWKVIKTVEASCLEGGYTEKECERCHKTVKADEVNALGHKWGKFVYNNDATYDHDGTETATCGRCGAKNVRTKEGTMLVDSLKGLHLYFGDSEKAEYGQQVILVAKADKPLPDGYSLAIFEGNSTTPLGSTDSNVLRVDLGKVKSTKDYKAKILDADGNVAVNSLNTKFEKVLTVNVKTGFFERIIAFIKGLFGLLPTKEIGAVNK